MMGESAHRSTDNPGSVYLTGRGIDASRARAVYWRGRDDDPDIRVASGRQSPSATTADHDASGPTGGCRMTPWGHSSTNGATRRLRSSR